MTEGVIVGTAIITTAITGLCHLNVLSSESVKVQISTNLGEFLPVTFFLDALHPLRDRRAQNSLHWSLSLEGCTIDILTEWMTFHLVPLLKVGGCLLGIAAGERKMMCFNTCVIIDVIVPGLAACGPVESLKPLIWGFESVTAPGGRKILLSAKDLLSFWTHLLLTPPPHLPTSLWYIFYVNWHSLSLSPSLPHQPTPSPLFASL